MLGEVGSRQLCYELAAYLGGAILGSLYVYIFGPILNSSHRKLKVFMASY